MARLVARVRIRGPAIARIMAEPCSSIHGEFSTSPLITPGWRPAQIAAISKVYGIWVGIGGVFLGGVVSFVRNKQPLFAIACGVASVLAFAGAVMWWG